MKKSILIVLTAMLVTVTFTQCLSAAERVDIPVLMDIIEIASIELNGAQIKLIPVPGTLDYEGSTVPGSHPIVTSNVRVDVVAETIPNANPSDVASGGWRTRLQNQGYNGTPMSDPLTIDPLATPFPLTVHVKAKDVDMGGWTAGHNNAQVATTVVTVTPTP